jgi:hypothetical protein
MPDLIPWSRIPIVHNEQRDAHIPPLDVQHTTVENVVRLLIKDKYTPDTFKNVQGWQGRIVRVVNDPAEFEYSTRTELVSLQQDVGNYKPIKYKVLIMDGPGAIYDRPQTYDGTPEDKRIIDSLDDYTISPAFNGTLSLGSVVWISNNNYRDKVIEYAFPPLSGSVADQQQAAAAGVSRPSNAFNNTGAQNTTVSQSQSVNQSTTQQSSSAWASPVPAGSKITSGYGARTNPITRQASQNHNGIDFAVPIGTSIFAPLDGIICVATEDTASGNYIILQSIYNNKVYKFGFAHLSEFKVTKGQNVSKGQVIALSGGGIDPITNKPRAGAGLSTGPHLHFTVRRGDESSTIDPLTIKELSDLFSVSSATVSTNNPDGTDKNIT